MPPKSAYVTQYLQRNTGTRLTSYNQANMDIWLHSSSPSTHVTLLQPLPDAHPPSTKSLRCAPHLHASSFTHLLHILLCRTFLSSKCLNGKMQKLLKLLWKHFQAVVSEKTCSPPAASPTQQS